MYREQPPGFKDVDRPDHVCHLKRALYGLRQAPRAWYDSFSMYVLSLGFICSVANSSLFVCQSRHGIILLLLYVDDIILTGDNPTFLHRFIALLGHEFPMKDLGPLHYFLGVEVHYFDGGIFLNQAKYSSDLLQRTHMTGCNSIATPMASKLHPPTCADDLLPDPYFYRSIVGGLQYLTFTRLDIAFSVNHVCQYMHRPTNFHFKLRKRIRQYV